MKIFAIGLNYDSHNKEMKRTFESKEPVLFMKPDTALLKDGKPFMLPDFSNEIHYETELVVKINRLGKNIAERFAHRYYDEITVKSPRELVLDIRSNGTLVNIVSSKFE
jgi:2-keto-4-pentenoate hydratase/2-oxohepta-3-ene-1,7-dioic acid hydratase in catechol pathway